MLYVATMPLVGPDVSKRKEEREKKINDEIIVLLPAGETKI